MPSASDDIRRAIQSDGPLRFDRFMELALYGPHGFYTVGGGAGRRGDFITSPEVGPLFGAVIARHIDEVWRRLDEPDDFVIVECGAGRGTLARSILAAEPRWRGRFLAVEIAHAQHAHHPDGVVSLAELPTTPLHGVIIANELLDNIPFRLAVHDGGWREVTVGFEGDRFVERTTAADPSWTALPDTAPHGARLPIQAGAAAWVRATRQLLRQGTVMAFDYCSAHTSDLLRQPWRAWLRTYRGHERGAHYLAQPGTQDITTQVCLDQLPAGRVSTQVAYLQRWGIAALVEEGRRAWNDSVTRADLRAMTMRSRVREAEALLDPSGLGSFSVVEWSPRTSVD